MNRILKKFFILVFINSEYIRTVLEENYNSVNINTQEIYNPIFFEKGLHN